MDEDNLRLARLRLQACSQSLIRAQWVSPQSFIRP